MADTFLFGPVHLLAFFTYTGLASGKPWDEVKHDVKRDFLPSYMTEGLGWAIIQVSVSL
jgi:protein Mpv17